MLVRITALASFAILATTAQVADPPFEGTYKIAVCKTEPCDLDDARSAQVTGYLVLLSPFEFITPASFPADLARQFTGGSRNLFYNGCYALTKQSLAPMTYAGITGAGLTQWASGTPAPGDISFSLYQSIDAGHRARAKVEKGVLKGTGESLGAMSSEPPPYWGRDVVVGRRIGPADLARCADRAREIQAAPRLRPLHHAVSAVPEFGSVAIGSDAAHAGQRFVVYLSASLLRPATQFERPGNPYRPGLDGIGIGFGGAPDIWTIGASARMADAAAYATEAVARVRTLLERGVAPARITILGAGPSTAIALDVARQIIEPINIALLGSCANVRAGDPVRDAPRDVFEVVESGGTPADGCRQHFGPRARIETLNGPSRPDSAYRGYMKDYKSIGDRPEDWTDAVARWIRAR